MFSVQCSTLLTPDTCNPLSEYPHESVLFQHIGADNDVALPKRGGLMVPLKESGFSHPAKSGILRFLRIFYNVHRGESPVPTIMGSLYLGSIK